MFAQYLPLLVWAFLAVAVAVGGWLGWMFGTHALYLRSLGADPGEVAISRGKLLRRQIRRVLWTILGAAGGAVAGLALVMFIARGA
jgi:hypothetical protein